MPLSAANPATLRAVRYARLLGYLAFLAAFFLPAVRQVATPGAGAPEVYTGYFCAWITIINSLNHEFWRSKDALAILSGWINPLMLLYTALLFSSRLRQTRRILAVLVWIFLAGTWVYFYLFPLVPLIGHWMWVAGILLIVAGEVIGPRRTVA